MTPEALIFATGCSRTAADRFSKPITDAMYEFRIHAPAHRAHFLAQVAHESAGFERLVENLNYSWQGLMKTWPSRFPSEDFARQFHRMPEKIANFVYASRMGNGPPSSGDGWKYRGRGLMQITGRYNYARCANAIGLDLVTEPGLLLDPVPAARSAAWVWDAKECSSFVDADDVIGLTRRINGGLNGLDDRLALTRRAVAAMEAHPWLG